MAVLRASQGTDMRADLWGGIVVAATPFVITATDGFHTADYGGTFQYPYTGLVSGYTPIVYYPFDPIGLGPVSGTVTSYFQDLGRLPQFRVTQFAVSAAPLFQAIRNGDPDLASALTFAGNDQILGSRGRDVLIGFGGNDTIFGNGGNDQLRGDLGADNLYGNDGGDGIRGGDGIDRLYGGGGNDQLYGQDARDFLHGDNGRDILTGNAGADRSTGGADADTFRFVRLNDSPAGSDSRDKVIDFTRLDQIDLALIDANSQSGGDQPFTFIGAAPFTDMPGQLRYTVAAHILSGDTDGDGQSDFQINLDNAPTITADDLLL